MISDIIKSLEKGTLTRPEFEEYQDRKEDILEELNIKRDIFFMLNESENIFYCNIFENNMIAIIQLHGLDVLEIESIQ